jgi:coenzyme F420-reducing hydrogenase delta subunit
LASMILSKIKGKEVDVEAEALSLLSEWAGDDKAKQAFAKVAFGGIFAAMGIDVTRSVSISFLPYGSPAANASVLYGALGGSVASAITELGKGGPGAGHRAFKKLSPSMAAFVEGLDMYKKGSFVAKGGGQMGVSKNEALFKTEGFKLWKERVAEIENTRNRLALENKRKKSLDVNATLADLLAKYISETDKAKADELLSDFTKKVSENPEAVNEDSIYNYLKKIILPREAVVLERAKTGIKSEEDIQEFLKQSSLKNLS